MRSIYSFLTTIVFILSACLFSIAYPSNIALGQTSSSSSGGSSVTLSDKVSGIWIAKVNKTVTVNGTVVNQSSRSIQLKLCVKNGEIRGRVFHPGFFTRALITSQNTISENEVEVTFKDRRDRAGTLRLKLIGDFQLNGDFSNGVSFVAKKINSFRLCEVFRTCDINSLFN